MSRILKHKKILILIILVAVFTTLFINRNRLSFLTSVSKDKYEYNLVEDGEERIKIDNENYAEGVTFDVYFLKDVDSDGNADGVRNAELMYGKSDKIYFDLNVSGDYTLKNGKIKFNNNNVKVSGTLAKSSVIPKTLSSTNYTGIDLSEVAPGTSSFFYLNVSPYIDTDLKKFSATNEVEFTGTIVNINTGEEVEVSKTISYDVDSYSKNINTRIGATTSSNPVNVATITYSIEVMETANAMPLKASYLTGSVSDFEGRHPTSVTVRSADGASIDYTYDSESQTFTAVKNAEVNDDKVITRQAYTAVNNGTRYNKWYITVVYPSETDEVLDNKRTNISLEAWNVGYTNSDLEEKKSNVVQRILSHTFTVLPIAHPTFTDNTKIEIGSYISSLNSFYVKKDFLNNVYLGQESGNFTFNERWRVDSKTDKKTQLLYTESGDRFASSSYLKDYTVYKSMVVSTKPNIPNYKIYIYNADNDELLHIITEENSEEVFNFPQNVRLIKILTSEVEENKNFTMNLLFTKEIDSEEMIRKVPLQNFLTYGTIANSGYVYEQNNGTNVSTGVSFNGNASFSESYSSATLSSTKTLFTREISETSIPMSFKVNLNTVDAANNLWTEGYFLLRLPKEMIDVENLSISPNSFIANSEIVDIDGQKFIKIIYNNTNSYNTDFNVSFNAVVNPKTTECSGYVDLYAINNTSTLYYSSVNDTYDINGNGSTTDKTSYSRLGINITAPKELLTGAIITEYDELESQTVSPLIADVNPKRDTTDANINLFLINNSSFKIKNIDIVGKVAYEGNKYEGIEGNLGSEYDTTMAGPIQMPDALNGKVTVYYSTVENPTRDINDSNNGWTQEVSDYSTIRSYFIKIDDSVEMPTNAKYDFYYPVDIPNDTANLLKKTYYNHGVYFKRVTDAGLKDASVTAPKLGIRTARKYDLDLDVYKVFTNTKIPGGQYILTDDEDNSKTITIDSNGHALVKDLYVNKEYTLKQYSPYNGYVKDEEEKTFTIVNGKNDELEISKDGTYRSSNFENNILNIDLENEIYYTLDLHNIDIESNADIKNTKFKVTGKNYESGKYVYTDSHGHAYLTNMELNQIYTVEQTKTDNYAIASKFSIKLERDPNTHEVKILIQSKPVPTVTENCHQNFDADGTRINYNTSRSGSNNTSYICYLEIDLTKYREKYSIWANARVKDYFYSSYKPELDVTVTRDETRNDAPLFIHLWTNGSPASYYQERSDVLNTSTAYAYNNGQFEEVDMMGGYKYYIYFRYKRGYNATATYGQLTGIDVRTVSNKNEFIFVDERENVHPKEPNDVKKYNENVTQTLKNYSLDSTSNPVLEVEIKNKAVEKAYIEINKIDGETNETLKGAQFKVSGPGLPEGGKYVTIDDNGKATIEVYQSFGGSYSYVPGINNNYPVNNFYTIEEVIAPKGYSVDSKTYTFKLIKNYSYNSSTKELTYNYRYDYDIYNSMGYNNMNNKFENIEIDEENKIWKVTVKDFPIVKVTKIDAETGVVLPNTYYAVYAVHRENGAETLDFAKDSDGNYIGEKLKINNQDYYVVKTDENGSFSLNLSSGQYQLREIQASDNKYKIDDQIIYFGIGDSIPYQAAGITLSDSIPLGNSSVNERNSRVYPTNDGGFIVTSIGGNYMGTMIITKLDKNRNEIWTKNLPVGYAIDYVYGYFDDPTRYVKRSHNGYVSGLAYNIVYKEYEDAYYFASYDLDMYSLDKETGEILFHRTDDNPGKYIDQLNKYCDITEGTSISSYSEYQINPNYTDKVYCWDDYTWGWYNYFQNDGQDVQASFSDDGYLHAFYQITANGQYGFIMKDGSKFLVPTKKITNVEGYENTYRDMYLLKFDKVGDIVEATPIGDIINQAKVNYINTTYPDLDEAWDRYRESQNYYEMSDYMISQQLPDRQYMNFFRILDNGDYLYAGEIPVFEYKYKQNSSSSSYYTRTVELPFVIRLDKDLNVVYFKFLGMNGSKVSLSYSSSYEDPYLFLNEDGTIDYLYTGYSTLGVDYEFNSPNIETYLLSTPDNIFTSAKEEGRPNGYKTIPVYRWDSEGNPETPIEIIRTERNPDLEDTTNDMKRVHEYYYYFNIAPYEDGYIVGVALANRGNKYSNSEPYRTVELKSGEVIRLNDNTSFIMYKVNADSSVEWIKQYGNIFSDRYGYNHVKIYGDKFYTVKVNNGSSFSSAAYGTTNGEIISSLNDFDYKDLPQESSNMLLEFELKDEVKAEAAEAYSLTLENKRKEYKVIVTNNDGGSFDVKDEDNSILYTGTSPGTIETIKHGDDSKNKLIIKPNNDYGIKSVTVNGEKASYTVNDDGTLLLNQFTNVQENINVNVQFELGSSRVVVHHYLKDTTTKISDDELLQGKINDSYETEAKADALYSLIKDSNDEYVLPSNYKGKFTREPIEVTYYYDVNKVDLVVNYFKVDTEEALAPSLYNQYLVGYSYFVEALDIPNYRVVNVLGDESGKLNRELTEVTYYYDTDDNQEPQPTGQGTVTVHHVANDTCRELVPPIRRTLDYNTSYTTEVLTDIPEGYRYGIRTDNYFGIVTEENNSIDVYYYYDRIKSHITVKYIDADTNEEIADRMNIYVNLGSRYESKESKYIPKGYKLSYKPVNATGIANEERIEVVYKYVKTNDGTSGGTSNSNKTSNPNDSNNPDKAVKGADEKSPNTGDFIGKYFIIGIISIIGILTAIIIVKKLKKAK